MDVENPMGLGLRSTRDEVRTLKDRAHSLLRKNKVAKALDCYERISHHEPEDLSILLKQGDLLRRLERSFDAIEIYDRVAKAYATKGQLLKALAACRLILEVDQSNQDALALVAELYAARDVKKPATATMKCLTPAPSGDDDPISIDVSIDIDMDGVALTGEIEVPFEEHAAEERHVSFPLFSDLPRESFIELVQKMDTRRYEEGDVIATVGEMARSIYIIAEGSVRISKPIDDDDDLVVAHLTEGDFFGEVALLAGTRRSSTIVASESTVVFEITRVLLDEIVKAFTSVEHILLRCYLDRMLQNLARTSPMLANVDADEREQFLEHFVCLPIEEGVDILTVGQAPDGLYVLLSGRAVVSKLRNDKWVTIAQLREGDTFGEISLLDGRPVSSRVRTTRNSMVLFLPKPVFDDLAGQNEGFVAFLEALAAGRTRETDAALNEITVDHICDVMTRSVHTVTPEHSIKQCIDIMLGEKISCVVVCAGTIPIDLISERDLLQILRMGLDTTTLGQVTFQDLVDERHVTTIESAQTVVEALQFMATKGIRRAPVVDAQGHLIGIVTQTNLLEYSAYAMHRMSVAERAVEAAIVQVAKLDVDVPKLSEALANARRALHRT